MSDNENLTFEGLFLRTLQNCKYYESCGKKQHLLNEIGALRGIVYVLEHAGHCPHTPEFLHFIDTQVLLLKSEVSFYTELKLFTE